MKTVAKLEEERLDGLGRTREDVERVLEMLGLSGIVFVEEIEKELMGVETAFQSFLILGIMARISHAENEKALKLFFPAVTNMKNYLPHPDLGGISPFEHQEKYPPGIYEMNFLSGLMWEYQSNLRQEKFDSPGFNIEEDFIRFQNEYLNRIPSDQSFSKNGKIQSYREIIIEERHGNNYPENDIEKMGAKIFTENTAEGVGFRCAEINDAYLSAIDELVEMQKKPTKRDEKSVKKLIKLFTKHEPYHKCGPEPHRFYLNFAIATFLADDIEKSFSLLDTALRHKPNYDLANEMKRRFTESLNT